MTKFVEFKLYKENRKICINPEHIIVFGQDLYNEYTIISCTDCCTSDAHYKIDETYERVKQILYESGCIIYKDGQ